MDAFFACLWRRLLIEFDDNLNRYRFRIASFSADQPYALPPRAAGCYLLLDPNVVASHGPGSHTVLYVGQTPDLRWRMVNYAKHSRRFRKIKRWVAPAPYLVLFAFECDATDIRFAPWECERLPDLLRRLEQRLKFLFVPAAPCREHLWAVKRGRDFGMTNQVLIDEENQRLEWVGRSRSVAKAVVRSNGLINDLAISCVR